MLSPNEFKSQISIKNRFPFEELNPENHILLYDQSLDGFQTEDFDMQTIVDHFSYKWSVKGGEAIKNFKDFPKNLEMLLSHWPQPARRSHNLVVMGGGSLGDFGGFAASVIKRGVRLTHIPTTWIAAMDSAHGGKTALNMDGVKNQIGSFYPAEKVYILKEMLESSPMELKEQAYGEFVKMGLVGESEFFKEILYEQRPANEFLWRFLKYCISDKYNIILQDPFERKGLREILNFGHTFGHVLESHFGWAHGESVMQGVFFALEWSRYRDDLSPQLYDQIMTVVADKFQRVPVHQLKWYKKPGEKTVRKLLEADKKINEDGLVNFVFLKNIGQPFVKAVPVEDLVSEIRRQNWVK